jgi:hypothetical protein
MGEAIVQRSQSCRVSGSCFQGFLYCRAPLDKSTRFRRFSAREINLVGEFSEVTPIDKYRIGDMICDNCGK